MASLQKNVASQHIKFCLVSATTGGADTGATVTVKVTKDAGAQASGGGTVTNLGNGQYDYAPTQAETNATDVGFLFTATGDIPVHADFHTDVVDANGFPSVNVADINAVSASSVTTINANLGTTGAVLFDGNGMVKADVEDWKGSAVAALVNGWVPAVTPIRSGTAQAGGASTITLDAGASATNNLYDNELVYIASGTGAGQVNTVSSYVGSTKVATMIVSWATNPDSTSVFVILPAGPISATVSGDVNVTQWNGSAVATPNVAGVPIVDVGYTRGTASAGAAGYVGIDWSAIHAPTTTVNLSGTTVGTLTTYTGNTPQTGDSFALIGATGSGLTSLAPAATALSTVQWTNTRASYLDNLSGGAVCLAGSAPLWYTSPPSAATITTAVLTTAMTESYAALHSAPTLAQAMFTLVSGLINQSLGGTQASTGTWTFLKLDGSTTAFTSTVSIDSGGNYIGNKRVT